MTSKSLLFRTGSARVPVHFPPLPASPRHSISLPAAGEISRRGIRRSSSEPNIVGSLSKMGSRSFSTPRIPEQVGGGMNNAGNSGGGGNGGSGSDADRHKMGAYYHEMIKSDPTNSLLLTNYAKYLYQVEGDATKAEEYYGRAILAAPATEKCCRRTGSRYGKRTEMRERAKSYFTQALQASPHDSTETKWRWQLEQWWELRDASNSNI